MKNLIRNRNYVLYWFGTAFSMAASNLIQFILSLYVLDKTGSATIFASMLSITIFPRLLLSPLAGVLGDRFNKRKWMVIWSLASGFVLGGFGVVYLMGYSLEVGMLYILVILLETFEVFYSSSSAGIIPIIVLEDELAKANSLARIDDGLMGIIGPILAALIYSAFGVGTGLIVASLMIIVSAFLIFLMKFKNIKKDKKQKESSVIEDFKEGLLLIKEYKYLKKIIILAPLLNFFLSAAFSVSIIYILRENFNVSNMVFGGFQAMLSVMGIIAPIIAMKIFSKMDESKILSPAVLIMGVGFLILTIGVVLEYFKVVSVEISIIALFVGSMITIGIIVIMNISISILFQKIIPINFMGRISSVTGIFATISIPIAQLLYGRMLDVLPSFWTLIVSTVGILIIYAFSKSLLKDLNHVDEIKIIESEKSI